MYDFLFVYEIKNRELENICLLKVELERRGYTVKLVETWYGQLYCVPKHEAKVVVAFALYNDGQIHFLYNFTNNVRKIVNLQWEQVFNVAEEENPNSTHNISGHAKNAVHIAWGNFNYNRLVNNNNVPHNNVFVCGQITFDFYKPLLEGYYLSREEICQLFGLIPQRRIHLFISSFSWCELPDIVLQQEIYQKLAINPFEFKKVSIESQRKILDWYEEATKRFPDIEFVYRPHPAEIGNDRLNSLKKKYSNFHVINQLSVKQWILVSEDIATWLSTSIAEVYAAGRNCAVLRPIELPSNVDIRYYLKCNKINNTKDFMMYISGEIDRFLPIDESSLLEYYQFDKSAYSYMKICDVFEKVIADEHYSYNYDKIIDDIKTQQKNTFFKSAIKSIMPSFIINLRIRTKFAYNRFLLKLWHKNFLILNNKKIESLSFYEKMIENNYSTDEEIREICKKIEIVIENNKVKSSLS